MLASRFVLVAFVFAAGVSSGAVAQSEKTLRHMAFRNLKAGEVRDFFSGKGNCEIVMEFAQGDKLPLSFDWRSDVLDLQGNSELAFVVRKPFLMKCTDPNRMMVSFDSIRYVALEEAFSGSFGAKVGTAGPESGQVTTVTLSAELNQRGE